MDSTKQKKIVRQKQTELGNQLSEFGMEDLGPMDFQTNVVFIQNCSFVKIWKLQTLFSFGGVKKLLL